LSRVFAATSLNARHFIGGDDELIILPYMASLIGFPQWRALPLTGVNIEDTAGLNGEVLVAREYPTAVVPTAGWRPRAASARAYRC
jgi:hypothetical protein